MFDSMDVGHLRKARSGSAFLANGTGDVRIKILGDQDEDVDIDDGDIDTAPYIGASLAGVSGGEAGVGTGAKSMAGSTLAPRVGVANVVSSTSSHGRREPHTAGSQASIGLQTLPQLTAGEDGSPKYADGSVPKVSTEGTSKRVHANDFRIRISETSGRVRRLSSVQVARSAHGSLRNDRATNQNAGSERNRSDDSAMLAFEKFPFYLSRICCMLDLPGPVKVRAGEIFKYFVQCQKHIRGSRPPHEIFAVQLCVVWMAAEQFNHAIDKAMSIGLVEERLNVSYTNRDQFVGELYKRVKEICNKFTPRLAPPVNVPLVEADPRLVPEERLDMLSSQSRVPEYEPAIQVLAGTITSGDSSLEQGLGWVLVSPVPESADVVTLEMPQSVIYLSDLDGVVTLEMPQSVIYLSDSDGF